MPTPDKNLSEEAVKILTEQLQKMMEEEFV